MRHNRASLPWVTALAAGLCVGAAAGGADRGAPWARHVIDDSSRGADGVRLADANGDGRLDIATGWEQGGVVRVYLHPGPERARGKWPAVTVGRAPAVEDAVFADLDGDGALDVVSCCEGGTRRIFVHWAPKDGARILDAGAWTTEAVPAAAGATRWMFALPMQLDGKHGTDLVAGSKNPDAVVGWLQAPARPRDLAAWRWHPLYKAGWIMSLVAADVDGDGDLDVVASDRKGKSRGCLWLENPGPGPRQASPWKQHRIGPGDREVMFLCLTDLDRDGLLDVVCAVRGRGVAYYRRTRRAPAAWDTHEIDLPPNTGTGKAVAAGDVDLDGKLDLVVTCEHARGKSGVFWMTPRTAPTDRRWEAHQVSGPEGTKYDLVELLDLDGDGDLDALTCEEAENLGVVWYENPTR
ncbi:MAG: FG-GAP repeat domain-containing protein [Candidatus Brocadiia bacterium]